MKKTFLNLVLISIGFVLFGQTQSALFPAYNKYIKYNNSGGNTVQMLPDVSNYSTDDNILSIAEKYVGQFPMYAQTIVYDDECKNDIKFFIVDNNLYNKFGRAFNHVYYNNSYGEQDVSNTFLLRMDDEEPMPNTLDNLFDLSNSFPYILRYKLDETGSSYAMVPLSMYNKIIVTPIPNKCNEYYIIFAVQKHTDGTATGQIFTFFRKLTFINDYEIELSSPISFDPYFCNLGIDFDSNTFEFNSNFNMSLSKYREDDNSFLLFMNYNSYLFAYKIDENGFEIWNDDNLTPKPIFEYDLGNYNTNKDAGQTEELEVKEVIENSGNKYYYIAFPNTYTNYNNQYLSLFKIDYNLSNTEQYNFYIGEQNYLKGLEFSNDAKTLYFTYKNQTNVLNYISTDFLETGASQPTSFSSINPSGIDAADYELSHIELNMDGKLNIPSIDGTLSTYNTTDGWQTDGYAGNITDFEVRYDFDGLGGSNNGLANNIFLTSQNDGQNYNDVLTAMKANCGCCTNFSYDYDVNVDYPFIDNIECESDSLILIIPSFGSPYYVVNPDFGKITILTGADLTWTPTDNPFSYCDDGQIYFKKDLIIEEGATLTLKDITLHFDEGFGVKVLKGTANKGAILNLDHAVLTADDHCIASTCGDPSIMWKGVELYGDNTPQVATIVTQPRINMYNNSMIEYAEWGIKSEKGGIVTASNSTFKDNIYATRLIDYYSNDISRFTKCTFKTSDVLYTTKALSTNDGVYPSWTGISYGATLQAGELFPIAFCGIRENDNIGFYGNTFVNQADFSNINVYAHKGKGIENTGALIKVNHYCGLSLPGQCNNEQKNSFENLYYGINARWSSGSDIQNADFINNVKGARFLDCNNIKLINNDFDVYNQSINSSTTNEVYGASIESSTGYTVQNNQFHNGIAGLYVKNSNELSDVTNNNMDLFINVIRHNQFYDLQGNGNETGLIVTGLNGEYGTGTGGDNGLITPCNKFENNNFAIAVIDGNMARIQLKYDIYEDEPTVGPSANWFDHSHLVNGETDFVIEDNGNFDDMVDEYQYNQYTKNSIIAEELLLDWDNPTSGGDNGDYYTFSNIFVSSMSDEDYQTWEEACIDEYPTGGGIDPFDPVIGIEISRVDLMKTEADTKTDELDAKIDGGNTSALLSEVEGLTQANYLNVCADLLDVGQYLSDKVLITFMDNQIMRPVAKTVVLMANSPLPVAAKQKIDELNVPNIFKYYLKQMQNGTYQREQDEMEISGLYAGSSIVTDKIIAFAMSNDTVPEKLDSIVTWLESKDDLKAYYRLVPIYIKQGEYEKAALALQELLAIAQTIGGTTLENAENYKTLQDINYQIMQNPENENGIIKEHLKELEIIAEGEGKNAGIAQYMLYNYNRETYIAYKEKYPLPDPNKSLAVKPQENNTYTGEKPDAMISVYPNPTNGVLNVEYINFENAKTINIYDLKGSVIMSFNANKDFGFDTINVSRLQKGTYLIGFGQNQTVKFIVK